MTAVDAIPQQGSTFKEALASHLAELFDKISVDYERAAVGLNLPEREHRVASDTGGSEHLGPASSSSPSAMALYPSEESIYPVSPQGRLFHQLRKKARPEWEESADKAQRVSLLNCVEAESEEIAASSRSDESSTAWATPKAPPSLDASMPSPPVSQPPNVVDIRSPTPDSKGACTKNRCSQKKVCWHSDTLDDIGDVVKRARDAPTPCPARSGSMKTDDGGEELAEPFSRKASCDSVSSQVLLIPGLDKNQAHHNPVDGNSLVRASLTIPGGSNRHPKFRDSGCASHITEETSNAFSARSSMVSNNSRVSSAELRPTEIRSSKRSCLKHDHQLNHQEFRSSTCSTKSAGHHFDVLRHWRTDDEQFRRRRTPPVKMGTGALIGYNEPGEDGEWDMLETMMFTDKQLHRLLQFFLIHPSSKMHATWEFLALMFVSYDIVTIPLEFFDPPQTQAILVMGWLVRFFWTADLVANFLTGYVNKAGDVEMRLRHIAKKYFRTWFILDFLIVLFNWMEVGFGHISTAPRSLRFLKIARLLRLLKASTLSRAISEKFRSEKMRLAFGILKILVLVLIVAHFIACLWYGVGNYGQNSWVVHFGFDDATLKMKYLSSFHWSVTQFTGPDMDLQPMNDTERSFTIIVLVSCYVVSACFVSSITTSMTRLELLAEHQTHLFVALRRYLDENSISTKLSSRIQRNATHAMLEKSRNVQEKEVELLEYVSEPLRIELHFEIYDPVVRVHPLFARYMEVSPAGIRKLCHTAVSVMSLSCGDVLFSDFEFPEDPRMYFLLPNGRLQYIRDGLRTQYLLEKEWCCEATLWTMWMHVGMMRAMTNVRLVTLGRGSVATAMSQFRTRDFRPECYAKSFVGSLNRGTAHLTDLRDNEMDWDGMLLEAFPKEPEDPTRKTQQPVGRKSVVGGAIKGAGMHFNIVPKMAEAWLGDDKFGHRDS